MMRSVREAQVKGARVIVRVDFNVPVKDGRVVDDFRIRRTRTTLEYLRENGAKVLIVSHLGRQGGTLLPVFNHLKGEYGDGITFSHASPGEELLAAVETMRDGDILLLENIRRHEEEEAGDDTFARELAKTGDIYVNDAFAVSHRAHASITGIPKFLPSYAGFLLEEEVENLTHALSPLTPSFAMIAGAKFETKRPLLERLKGIYTKIAVGGALANDFFKAKGYEVGLSRVSDRKIERELLDDHRLLIPSDVIVAKDNGEGRPSNANAVAKDERIMDIGEATTKAWTNEVEKASFVLWNGNMGIYERGFTAGDHALADALIHSNAKAVIGGGDTIASLKGISFDEKRVFLSTGGGAMLEFLAQGTLPGIEALEKQASRRR